MTITERTMTPDEAGRVFITPAAYADLPLFHEACRVLRDEDPVHLVDEPGFTPFWVLTRYDDVHEASRRNDVFFNTLQPVLANIEAEEMQAAQGPLLRTLVHMDEPDHRIYRNLTSEWFLPKSLAQLNDRLADLACRSVDRMVELGDACDFAQDIAMPYPLQVILAILGLPESDYARMLKLTQELFGATDEELARQGDDQLAALMEVIADFFAYFQGIIAERRADPTGDLASVIANAGVDGRLLDDFECISYYVIIATAGHDTTSTAMAGGMQALIEHPDQLERLRRDPSLITTAADEVIRWITPVKHFMRHVQAPVEIGGHRFRPGDRVYLCYPSANRDERAFDDPFRFDVGRSPNKHLSFGFGAHYCLGAMLARMEIKALFTEIVARVDDLAITGPPELSAATLVSGLKHLPISYRAR